LFLVGYGKRETYIFASNNRLSVIAPASTAASQCEQFPRTPGFRFHRDFTRIKRAGAVGQRRRRSLVRENTTHFAAVCRDVQPLSWSPLLISAWSPSDSWPHLIMFPFALMWMRTRLVKVNTDEIGYMIFQAGFTVFSSRLHDPSMSSAVEINSWSFRLVLQYFPQSFRLVLQYFPQGSCQKVYWPSEWKVQT
jgi:hypothetical protein